MWTSEERDTFECVQHRWWAWIDLHDKDEYLYDDYIQFFKTIDTITFIKYKSTFRPINRSNHWCIAYFYLYRPLK